MVTKWVTNRYKSNFEFVTLFLNTGLIGRVTKFVPVVPLSLCPFVSMYMTEIQLIISQDTSVTMIQKNSTLFIRVEKTHTEYFRTQNNISIFVYYSVCHL